MAKEVELYTTDFALEAQGASYKGLIIVNKVSTLKIRGVAHLYRHKDSIRLCWGAFNNYVDKMRGEGGQKSPLLRRHSLWTAPNRIESL